jgi:hypothetical protein
MSKRKKIRALHDALADSVLSLSEEQLSQEVREEGLDPNAVAEDTRALLLGTVKQFQQRALTKARVEHEAAVQKLQGRRPVFPSNAQARRDLLIGVLTQQPAASGVLTAQWREFSEMTDEDVETALLELAHLGFIVTDEPK